MSIISNIKEADSTVESGTSDGTSLIEIPNSAATIRVRRSPGKAKSRKRRKGERSEVNATLAVTVNEDILQKLSDRFDRHRFLSLRAGVVAFAHRAACGITLGEIQVALGRGHYGKWLAAHLPTVSRRTIQRWQKDAKRWPKFCKAVAKQAGRNATSMSHLGPEDVLEILGEEESGKILDGLGQSEDGAVVGSHTKKGREQTDQAEVVSSDDSAVRINVATEQAEWITPQAILNQVLKLLGHIDLDPCSSESAPRHVPASQYYTANDDGLIAPWQGHVFLNPGLSPMLDRWVKRAVHEVVAGHAKQVLLLLPALTDADWAADLQPYPRAFLYVRPQVFVPASNTPVTLAHPLMIVHISATDRTADFADHIGVIGDVFVPFRIE
jgi:hypothetical protein